MGVTNSRSETDASADLLLVNSKTKHKARTRDCDAARCSGCWELLFRVPSLIYMTMGNTVVGVMNVNEVDYLLYHPERLWRRNENETD